MQSERSTFLDEALELAVAASAARLDELGARLRKVEKWQGEMQGVMLHHFSRCQ